MTNRPVAGQEPWLRERIRVRTEHDWDLIEVPDEVAPGVVLLQRLGKDDQVGRCRFAAFWCGWRPGVPAGAPQVVGEVYLADLAAFAHQERDHWNHRTLGWPDGGPV